MPAPVSYIKNEIQLQDCVTACLEKPVVSIDTEFARYNTYYPIVGLIQIYDGDICYLIDPLEVTDLSALQPLLTDSEVTKVFHACTEDMEVFQQCIGVLPNSVFDSQIAAAALGVGFSISYQNLVEHYLDLKVPKEETRSDWLQRPLTEGQLKYAALDVIYLLQVYEMQQEQLLRSDRWQWVEQECASLSLDLATMIDPDLAYKKIKGLARLNRKQLSVMRALCSWREKQARALDVPRNRILDQKALMSIAIESLGSISELQSVAEMSPRQVRKFGDDIIFLAIEARQLPEDQCPGLEMADSKIDSKQLGRLREVVRVRAEALSVAPELLTKRRHLEKLLRSEDAQGRYTLPEELTGWRRDAIGDELIRMLHA